LRQSGHAPAQRAHQRLAFGNRGAEMHVPAQDRRGAGNDGLMRHSTNAASRAQRFDVVVHAAQQHRLADHRDAGIDDARAGGAPAGVSSRG